MRTYVAGVRFLLGGVLLFAALSKMQHPFRFLSDLYDYELVGRTAGLVLAVTLPAFELLAAILLIFGLFLRVAFAAASLLGVLFTISTASAVLRSLDIACGCFSGAEIGRVGYDTVIRSTAMLCLAVSAWGLTWYANRRARSESSSIANRQCTEMNINMNGVTHGIT